MSTTTPKMRYRRFGRTELQIPVFSCGGMRYQQTWGDGTWKDITDENQANLEACINRSLELGINHIETARGYGTSEMQLGKILPTLPREKMIIQTKVAPTADPKEFVANFEKSMSLLKLDYVDLFSLHGINTPEVLEWSLRKGGCLEFARQWQKEGRVRHIGYSTHAPNHVIEEANNTGEFDYVNLHWYFVNNLNWPGVLAGRKHDMGIFIISPTDKGGKLYAPPAKLVERCAPLSPIAFNDLYCLSRPEVHTLSVGVAKPSDFDEHVNSLVHYDEAEKLTAPIVARLNQEIEGTIGAEFFANWAEGLPDSTKTPGEVNIPEIVRLWIYAKSLDMTDWGNMRYNLLGQAGHWFPGHPVTPEKIDDLADALKASPFPDRVRSALLEADQMLRGEKKERLSKSE